MKRIALDKAVAGDIVARDIKDEGGAFLVSAGTELTAELIDLLAEKEVRYLRVREYTPGSLQEKYTQNEMREIVSECRQSIEKRLLQKPAGKTMAALYKAVLKETVNRRLT